MNGQKKDTATEVASETVILAPTSITSKCPMVNIRRAHVTNPSREFQRLGWIWVRSWGSADRRTGNPPAPRRRQRRRSVSLVGLYLLGAGKLAQAHPWDSPPSWGPRPVTVDHPIESVSALASKLFQSLTTATSSTTVRMTHQGEERNLFTTAAHWIQEHLLARHHLNTSPRNHQVTLNNRQPSDPTWRPPKAAAPTSDEEEGERDLSSPEDVDSRRNTTTIHSTREADAVALPGSSFRTGRTTPRTTPLRPGDPDPYAWWTPSVALGGWRRVWQLLRQNPRVLEWTSTGLQIGLIFYLAHVLWKAGAELWDELSEEVSGTTLETALGKRDQVTKVLAYLEEQQQQMLQQQQQLPPELLGDKEMGTSLLAAMNLAPDGASQVSSKAWKTLPPMPLLQLGQKLWAAGLPLRSTSPSTQGAVLGSSEEHAPGHQPRSPHPSSVESVLLSLSKAEAAILQQCLWSSAFHPLDQVIGLDDVKQGLLRALETIRGVHAQEYASLFDGARAASGILVYGPPGCGKTMLIKAVAASARLPCLVVTPSLLLRKYYGDSNLQVRSLFSLANKLAPLVLVIDELDGLFRERSESEHEASRDLKTEFLQWWDGMLTLSTSPDRQILVIGATNRPFDVDSAVLRRLPQSYFVGLPDTATRAALIQHLLRNVPKDARLDVPEIARRSEMYSPSDLRQVLQRAALSGPLREGTGRSVGARPLTTQDVLLALKAVPSTPLSPQYRLAMNNFLKGSARSMLSPEEMARPAVHKWETDYGNFYDVGTLEVDQATFDLLARLAKQMIEDSDANKSKGDHDQE